MLKNKIYKYFTLEIMKLFLTILFAFTAIAWTVRAVNFLDLIVDSGYSVKTYLQFSIFNVTIPKLCRVVCRTSSRKVSIDVC